MPSYFATKNFNRAVKLAAQCPNQR